jgi:hypothetical protein
VIFERIFARKFTLAGFVIKKMLPSSLNLHYGDHPKKTADKLGFAGGQINAGKFFNRPILKGKQTKALLSIIC